MESEQLRIIRRILRVNHSGEHGAVAIYSSQISRARKRCPELLPWLEDVLSHEIRHRKAFLEAMPSRGAKPCRAMFVWKAGGALLGAITALFGKSGVMICTAAVERTVHNHLVEQVNFLNDADAELAIVVKDILAEEDQHLADAENMYDQNSIAAKSLSLIIAFATETLIFLSTRGDSRKLRATMALTA